MDAPNDSAVRALVDRLLRRGVIVIVAADDEGTAWGSRAAAPWWIENVHAWTRQLDAPWRVPTLLVVDPSMDDTVLTRALSRLARQPLGIVLTPALRHDPANPKQLLHESWTPSYGIEDLLRKV